MADGCVRSDLLGPLILRFVWSLEWMGKRATTESWRRLQQQQQPPPSSNIRRQPGPAKIRLKKTPHRSSLFDQSDRQDAAAATRRGARSMGRCCCGGSVGYAAAPPPPPAFFRGRRPGQSPDAHFNGHRFGRPQKVCACVRVGWWAEGRPHGHPTERCDHLQTQRAAWWPWRRGTGWRCGSTTWGDAKRPPPSSSGADGACLFFGTQGNKIK